MTNAPREFNTEEQAKIRRTVTELRGRRYKFIIGIDLLNCFKTMINLVDGYISFNDKITNFILNPYKNLQICTLEGLDFDLSRIQLDHLNTEEYGRRQVD